MSDDEPLILPDPDSSPISLPPLDSELVPLAAAPPPAVPRAAPVAVPPPDLTQVGPYQLREVIRRGPGLVAYRGFEPVAGREAVVTVFAVSPDRPTDTDPILGPARRAAALSHPGIVPVLGCGTDGGWGFVALPPTAGTPLSSRAADARPALPDVVQAVRNLALALQYAHDQGMRHGSVCPAFVTVEESGRPRLTFGVPADPSCGRPTSTGVIGYAAPEQVRGDATVGPRSDVYALGVVLYELLAGRRPFADDPPRESARTADTFSPAPSVRDIAPSVPLGLEAVVAKALQKDPWGRYGSAADFAVDLQRVLTADTVSTALRTDGPPRDCPNCRRPNKGTKPRCTYCDANLETVGEVDPGGGWASGPRGGHEWDVARVGLWFHSARLVSAMVLTPVCVALILLDAYLRIGGGPLWGIPVAVIPTVCALLGSTLCLTAPTGSRARGLFAATLTFDLFAVLLSAASQVAFILGPAILPQEVAVLVVLVGGILSPVFSILAWFTLLVAVSRSAATAGSGAGQNLADEAIRLSVVLLVAALLVPPLLIGGAAVLGLAIGSAISARPDDATQMAEAWARAGTYLTVFLGFGWLFFVLRLTFDVIHAIGEVREATRPRDVDAPLKPIRRRLRRGR